MVFLPQVGNNIDLRRSPQHNGSTCKAYYCRFVHPVLQSRLILWAGYINMAKPQIIMPGVYIGCVLARALWLCSSAFPFSLPVFGMIVTRCSPGLQHTLGSSIGCRSRGGGCCCVWCWRRCAFVFREEEEQRPLG